jgi:hypothetical protein
VLSAKLNSTVMLLGAASVMLASRADESHAAVAGGVEELLKAGQALLGAAAVRAPLHVVVSDIWLVEAEIPWAAQLLEDEAARSYVGAYFEMLGASAAQLTTVLDGAPYGEPRLACAIPTSTLDAIVSMTGEGGSLASVVPLSSFVWSAMSMRVGERDCDVAVIEDKALSVMTIVAGRVRRVQTHRYSGSGIDALERFWRRLKLRFPDSSARATLYVVDLTKGATQSPTNGSGQTLPAGMRALPWDAPKLNAAPCAPGSLCIYRSPIRASLWQRIAAAALVACVGLGLWAVVTTQQRIEASQQTLVDLERKPPPPAKRSAAQQREHDQELKAVTAQLDMLAMPLDDLFAALSPPASLHAAILSLDMTTNASAEPAAVRLEAQAESSAAMTQFVAHLRDAPPFNSAYLTRHEVQDDNRTAPYVFTVEARWTR